MRPTIVVAGPGQVDELEQDLQARGPRRGATTRRSRDVGEAGEPAAGEGHDEDRDDDRDDVDEHSPTVAMPVCVPCGPTRSIAAMAEPEVLYDASGGVARVTINRPERRNAMSYGVMQGLRDAVAAAKADESVRVVVLTGAGDRAFCAGADLGGHRRERGCRCRTRRARAARRPVP